MNAINETPQTDAKAEMISTHRCNERLMVPADFARDLERRCNLLEAKLVALGDIAVSQWDDKVVGEVDALVPPEQQTKYADFLRNLFIEIPAERDRLRLERGQWKANHDNQVKLRRTLMDRPDLGDRAKRMQELIAERDSAVEAMLRTENERLSLIKVCDELYKAALDYDYDTNAFNEYNKLPHVKEKTK